MDFKQLQSFVAVVNTGSFSRAATILYISQPSISTHIKLLEEEVGTPLLVRTSKNIELTDAGKSLYEYAVSILRLKERMIESCKPSGKYEISIGSSTVPSAYILPDIISGYCNTHKNVTFSICQRDSLEIINGIKDGMYDIGFVGTSFDNTSLEFTPICSDEAVLIVPNLRPYDQYAMNGSLEKLLKCPLILRENGSGTGLRMQSLIDHYHIEAEELNVVARSNDPEAVKKMVMNGLGIACISKRATEEIDKNKLIVVNLPKQYSMRKLYLVTKRASGLDEYMKEFYQYVCNMI